MKETFIHSTSVIDQGAIIGEGTTIWYFCHLMPGTQIGEDCTLGQNVFIDNNVTLGNRVKVQNNVSLYNGVLVEDDVFIGPSAVFTNVLNPRSFISRKDEFKPTIVRRGASIGANATIVCGVQIGEYALIGAGAVVTKNIMPFSMVVGNPAMQTGWVSKAGHKLMFDGELSTAICPQGGELYRLFSGKVELVNG